MIWRKPCVRTGLSFDDVLLVPQRTSVSSRGEVELSTELVPGIPMRLPLISANTPWCTEDAMAIGMAGAGGCGVIHRMQPLDVQAEQIARVKRAAVASEASAEATTDASGALRVGAAVGVKGDFRERAREVVAAGADVLVLDIAHGHSAQALQAVEHLRSDAPEVPLIAGNVATAAGTRDLVRAGASAVKVGIGPGGICTTRRVAGAGVPQITAIMDCAEAAAPEDVPIIADGGVRSSGDMAKALAAGASSVMLGSLLAGTDESSAVLVEDGGTRYKITTGFVTLGMELTLKHQRGEHITRREMENYVPEGVEATFEHTGPLTAVLKQYAGGIRSGMSYSGARTVPELHAAAEFVRVSAAGLAENRPHAVERSAQVHPDYRSDFLASSSTD